MATVDLQPSSRTATTVPHDDAESAVASRSILTSLQSVLTRNHASSGIFLILVCIVLIAAKDFFLPIAFAIMGNFLLTPLVRRLSNLHIPRPIAAFLVLSLLGWGVGFGIVELAGPATTWMNRLPQGLHEVKAKLTPLRGHVESMRVAAQQVQIMTNGVDDPDHPAVTVVPPSTVASSMMSVTGEVVGGLILMTITLFFLLSTGSAILDRAVRHIPGLMAHNDSSDVLMGSQAKDTVEVLRDSERRVCLYLATTVIINSLLALVLAVGFKLAGMPNPVLWGVVAGCLNFLPYVGPLIGVPLVGLAALISFPHLHQALIPPAIYMGCAFLEGNIITPAIIGNRLNMSPLAVFLWMAIWGWMWGPAGAVIAVPMLVMVESFCRQIDTLKPIAELIEA